MRKINSISLAVISMCAATMAFSSCQKEELRGSGSDGRGISILVSTEKGVETKSGIESYETVDLSEDNFSLYVSTAVTINKMDPFAPATKGAVVTKDDISTFNVNMLGVGSGVAKQDGDHYAIFTNNGEGPKLDWPEDDGEYTFVADYLNSENSTFASSTMKYSSSASTASQLNDLLIAEAIGETHDHATYHNPNYYVKLHFYHALAGVRFNIDGTVVKKIIINNVAKDGTVTYNATEGAAFYEKFTWATSETTSYEQSYTEASPAIEDRTFFLIPQTLTGSDVTMTFVISTKEGGERQITAKASKFGVGDWKPGYIYNYTVSTSVDGGDVDITANVNATVTNNARGSAYVRAAVIGNYVDAQGRVTGDWNGTLSTNTADGGPWVKIGKYYYTTSPVFGYDDTEALISTFPTESGVKISMLVQAIAWDSTKENLKNAWSLTDAEVELINID